MARHVARTGTLRAINQYMEDAEVDMSGELDLVTFICAAQAIRPDADTTELMQVFESFSNDEQREEDIAGVVHNLLQKVSKPQALETVIEEPEEDSSGSEEDYVIHHGRRLTVLESAQMEATADLAQMEQKMMIAKEMLREGIEPGMVANVTGIPEENLNYIADVAPEENETKETAMEAEDIAQVLRLINGGPETIQKEANLVHSLLIKMKDALISGARINFQKEKRELTETPAEGTPNVFGAPKPAAEEGEERRELYEVVFEEKPLGMSWNQTSDGKNLYVQEVLKNGLAEDLGVIIGSVIYKFNESIVYDQGPETIYEIFKKCELPIKVGFMPPAAQSGTDAQVLILKQVTGLETETVIKLLHKFNGNVQAANEAFYIAKARTRQWIAKQKQRNVTTGNKKPVANKNETEGVVKPQKEGSQKIKKGKKKSSWWGNWVRKIG